MKKIITLVTMFVLSVGFLMAQGVFTYQAVVVDAQGNLVANQQVTAIVKITDAASHSYEQSIPEFTTSPNGLAVLSIGDNSTEFNSIDWKTAKIKVEYNVTGITMPEEQFEQIAAVPYALQSKTELSNEMIADYVRNATMDDVNAILEATEHNQYSSDYPSLHDQVLAAVVDSVIHHYDLAKEILLSYINDADEQDVDTLFEALTGNTKHVMDSLAAIVVKNLSTPEGKEMIYDVLKAYAPQLTGNDVGDILDAVTPEVKDTIIRRAVKYYLLEANVDYNNELIHEAMSDLAKYYINHIDVEQVKMLISTVKQNQDVYDVLKNQFDVWIDKYVDSVVADYINQRYFKTNADCSTLPDLCAVKAALEGECAIFDPATPTFENWTDNKYFEAVFSYSGPVENLTAYSLQINIGTADNPSWGVQSIPVEGNVTITTNSQIAVSISYGTIAAKYGITLGDVQDAVIHVVAILTLNGKCNGEDRSFPVTIQWID